MSRWLLGVAVLVGSLVVAPAAPSAAEAAQRDEIVTSFDGTPIVVHFFPADGLGEDGRAPLVMLAHGYGEDGPASRSDDLAGAPSIDALLRSGYNVLTWDARGHGGSGGTAMLDSPDFEVRDVQALLDWAALQDEVQLDGPGDPRVGMTGASYGGIIQFSTAALDRRVDVINPSYTGHSLSDDMIAPHGRFKETWSTFLLAATAQTVPPGVVSPAGPQLHTPDPEAMSGLGEGVLTGRLSPGFRAYLDHRSPSRFVGQVRVPTLLHQGTTDLLFPLGNAIKNYEVLRRNDVPVKMSWNCEGHSLCGRDAGPAGRFTETTIRWFDRWLKRDESVDTGPTFEWIADNEAQYRSSRTFPPRVSDTLTATGSGSLAVAPTSATGGGGMIFTGGRPSPDAVDVDLPAPAGSADVLGAPRVEITYSGLALPRSTHLYAQLVDVEADRVVGGQVTPIPVRLDGRRHVVSQPLAAIATRAHAESRYRLQVLPGSLTFGSQRSTGAVTLHSVRATLPIVDPAGR